MRRLVAHVGRLFLQEIGHRKAPEPGGQAARITYVNTSDQYYSCVDRMVNRG